MSASWCSNYLCLALQCDTPILEAIFVRFAALWLIKDFLEIATHSNRNPETLKNLQEKYDFIQEQSDWNSTWCADSNFFRLSNQLQCQIVFSKVTRRFVLYFVFELEQGIFQFTCCDLCWKLTTLGVDRIYMMIFDGKLVSRPMYLKLDSPNFNLKSAMKLLFKEENSILAKWPTLCIRPFNYTTTDPMFVEMVKEFYQIKK